MRILKFINHFEFSNHFVTSLCFNSDVLRVPTKALSRERSHGVIMQGTGHASHKKSAARRCPRLCPLQGLH